MRWSFICSWRIFSVTQVWSSQEDCRLLFSKRELLRSFWMTLYLIFCAILRVSREAILMTLEWISSIFMRSQGSTRISSGSRRDDNGQINFSTFFLLIRLKLITSSAVYPLRYVSFHFAVHQVVRCIWVLIYLPNPYFVVISIIHQQ